MPLATLANLEDSLIHLLLFAGSVLRLVNHVQGALTTPNRNEAKIHRVVVPEEALAPFQELFGILCQT